MFGYTRIQDLIAALEECPNGATEVKNLESILSSNNLPNAACTTQLSLGTPLNSAVVGACLDEHSSFTEKSHVQAFYECLTRTTTTSSITTTGSSITRNAAMLLGIPKVPLARPKNTGVWVRPNIIHWGSTKRW